MMYLIDIGYWMRSFIAGSIDPFSPSIDYLCSLIIMELDDNIQRSEPFKMLTSCHQLFYNI